MKYNIMEIATAVMAFATVVNVMVVLRLGRLSISYSKNAVRPVCVISVEDYYNKISVSILNTGTGPMMIKEFSCTNGTRSTSDLISLMPELDQSWTTFYKKITEDAIVAGGKATLIGLNPETEETRCKVRDALKDITVFVEYADVHNTVFTKSKKLDFFGRPMKPGK
jgi:hypothetical protein